jgi:hypothetical protein
MTDMLCGYLDRDETIVAFLYDDLDGGRRRLFDAHLLTCAACREEVAALRGVRAQLSRWEPPAVSSLQSPVSSHRPQSWWRTIPAWAQVAAALLFLGVAAGIAQLDVRYDRNGLSVRTGWSRNLDMAPDSAVVRPASRDARVGGPEGVGSANTAAPWRPDLAALEQQLKTEFHASQGPAATLAPPMRAAAPADAETIRRVRTLIEDSEKRQQRELALRVAEVLRDVNAQRQADLIKIDRSLGVVSNNAGVDVLKSRRELMDYIQRVSLRQ